MSKYHAQPLVLDNIRFASTKEAHRYQELKLLERAQDIRSLEWQTPFTLAVNGMVLGKYFADFTYVDREERYVVEDVKGVRTPLYRWKRKHVLAQYGHHILEV